MDAFIDKPAPWAFSLVLRRRKHKPNPRRPSSLPSDGAFDRVARHPGPARREITVPNLRIFHLQTRGRCDRLHRCMPTHQCQEFPDLCDAPRRRRLDVEVKVGYGSQCLVEPPIRSWSVRRHHVAGWANDPMFSRKFAAIRKLKMRLEMSCESSRSSASP